MKTTDSKEIKVFLPQDFPAPCGCKTRFDNDGIVRLEMCNIHNSAPELLEACKAADLAIQREKLLQAERGESVAVDLGFAHSKLLAAIAKAEGA